MGYDDSNVYYINHEKVDDLNGKDVPTQNTDNLMKLKKFVRYWSIEKYFFL